MAINPISTDASFFKSLRSINSAQKASSKTIENLSTDLEKNSPGGFAIAQELRGKIQVSSALKQGLSSIGGTVSTGLAGVNALSDLTVEIQSKLIELSNDGNSEAQTNILNNEVENLLMQAQTFVSNSSFNDVNLIESGAEDVSAITSESGNNFVVSAQTAVGSAVTELQSAVTDASKIENPQAVIQNELAILQASLSNANISLGGAQSSIVESQDSLLDLEQASTEGLGNLVDANIARETILSTSQNVQAQLATQALSIANSSANSIVKLFK